MRSFLEKILICSVVLTLFIAYIPFEYFALQAEAKNVEEKSVEKKPIELVELRTENAKTFDNLDGTYTAEIAQEPIHYQDKQGNWEEIDNSLVETNNGKTVTNKANDFSVEIDKTTAASQQNITITDDEKKIDFGLVSAQHEKDNKNEQVQNAKGVVDSNTIRYQNVLKDTDLVYTIGSNQIKEDIIYSEKPKDGFPKKFTYKLNIPGMNVLKEEDNIYLVNSKTKQKLYLITAPYMYDSFVPKGFVSTKGVTSIPEEAISYDIKLDYEEVNGEHFIYVIPNKEWLESNERVYPITIDPTIVNLQSMPYVEDTNLRSAFPTQTGGNDQELGSGKASDGNIIRTLMKFDVSSLPKDAVVLNSNLNLWYSSTNNASAIDVGLYKVTKNWEENEASWTYAKNNPYTLWSSKGGDYDATNRLSITNIGAPSELDNDMKSWDIPANIVEGWIKNSATNQGLLLKSEQENLAIYKKFVSSEKSILQKYKPLISITYAEPAAELQKSENLLHNGDFEGNLPLNGWKRNNYNTGTITQDQTESSPKSNDNRSVKITIPKGSWDLKEMLPDLKQEIKVEGAQLYDISFYAKQNIKGLGTTIEIMEWSNDDKATLIDYSQISESTDWTEYKKLFKTSPNAKSIIITISPFRSMQESESYGEVFLDSISFGKVSNLEEEVHETHEIWALFKNKKSLSTVEIDPDKKAQGKGHEFSFRHTIPDDKGIVSEEKAYARKIIPVEKLTSYYIQMQQMVGSDSKNITPNIKVILKDENDNTIKIQNFSGSSKGGIWREIKGIITTTENTKNIEVRTDFIRDSVNESQGDIWFSNGLFVNRIEPTISDELIINGEFKEELFNNWVVDKDSSGTAEITTGTFNKGKSSLALTFTSNDILNSLSVMQEVNIEPNTVYEISGFSKMLKQTDGLEPRINIEFFNSDGLILDGLSSTTLNFNKETWTQKSLKFKTTPTTSKIRIKLTAYGLSAKSGTVYFDDLSLHKFYGAPILNYGSLLVGQNLLKNASFNSTLDNWNVEHYDDSSTVSTDTETSPFSDDSKSLKVGIKTTTKKDDFGNDDFGNVLIKQKVNIEPNSYYVLDGYVKELNLKNAVYQLNIVIHNKDKTTEDYYYMTFGNSYSDPNEWIKKRLGIKTGSNASQVEVILQVFTKGIEASGTVWFDDLKLVKQNFINDYDLSPLGGSTFRPEMSFSQIVRQIEIPSINIDFGSTFEEMNATLREMEKIYEELEKFPWDQVMKDFNEAGDKMKKAFKQINSALAQMNSSIDGLVEVQGEMIDTVNKTNQVMDNIIKKHAEINQSIYSLTYDANKMNDILSSLNNVSTDELKSMFLASFDTSDILINGKPANWKQDHQAYEEMNVRMALAAEFMPVYGQLSAFNDLVEGGTNKNASTYDLLLATIGVVGGGVGRIGVKTTIEVSGDAIKEVDKIVETYHRKNNQRSRFRDYTGYEASGEVHHGLPEEFHDWFKDQKVDINDPKYYYDLPKEIHRLKVGDGIHTNNSPLGNNWNAVWKEFIADNPHATKEQIEEQLKYMTDTCDITHLQAQPKKK
ncbi:DNRLRE domain-containing protein [Lysinibacillus sp. CNPSo 3705]|uniref:DNRLRE domain-containing protein n=1 Tax=Lysinibacillus sp. CNPSo 3705 TaxID=3028148 RepID=UPI0023639FD2|nr:DNRLRE domain-containing protein [Lysinibacillus sp. CNPSo 3705]MDD1505808.1 DNRLRE domain-containing protein [Lysinibacillus sp. CNPSo 3705]